MKKVNTPTLAIIPTLHFSNYSTVLKYITRKYNRLFRHFVESAQRIVTTSGFTKMRITDVYNINADLVDVLSSGAIPAYKVLTEVEKENVRKQYLHGLPYFLVLDNTSKQESIINVLKAFEHYKQSSDTDVKIVIIYNKKN